MNRLIPLSLLLAFTTISFADSAQYPLLKVEDGDTLVVEMNGQPVRMQLAGIDAPEDVENPKLLRDIQRTGKDKTELLALGRAATSHLRNRLAAGSSIVVEGELKRKDRYGRIPVVAKTPAGDTLNAAMVQQGYAVVMRGYRPDNDNRAKWLKDETEAVTSRKGLWGSHTALMSAWSGKAAAR